MTTYHLGQGISVDLDVKPSFPFAKGKAELKVPDDLFRNDPEFRDDPDVIGGLHILSGPNPQPKKRDEFAMSDTADVVLKTGNARVGFGFKQICLPKAFVAFYAGLKDSDGSIEESMTGPANTWTLDCTTRAEDTTFESPQAPWFIPPEPGFISPAFKTLSFDMMDQTGGVFRLGRRNYGRDRHMFLVYVAIAADFATVVVGQLPSGEHVPLEGFLWTHNQEVEVAWTDGKPAIRDSTSHIMMYAQHVVLSPNDIRFKLLANARLGSHDTLSFKVNDDIRKANLAKREKRPSVMANYSIEEFDHWTDLVRDAMKPGAFHRHFP
jgi:hypothetical protein